MDLKDTIKIAAKALQRSCAFPHFGDNVELRGKALTALREMEILIDKEKPLGFVPNSQFYTGRTAMLVNLERTHFYNTPVYLHPKESEVGLPVYAGPHPRANVAEGPQTFRRNNGLATKYKAGEAIDFSTLLDNFAHHVWADGREGIRVSDDTRAARQLFFNMEIREPIPMVLYCPSCHTQHIDAPKSCDMGVGCQDVGMCYASATGKPERCTAWSNPPHRSHLCHNCGTIWRPADVPTTGVEKIHTAGKNDTTKEAIAAGRAK